MPIYTYRCPKCERTEEHWLSINDNFKCTCSKCRVEMRKLLDPANVQYKGTGFYSTDYREDSPHSDNQ